MNFKATFKLPKSRHTIIVEGTAKDKKEFLKNCSNKITEHHKLLKCEEI